ncbi:Hypothetical protein PHPALM_116 [Phytophthora palmivora]|uniref:DUF659 domain-containing protein n=1 Tax=Phytophthora palmivora TaxID=4796 RepID=A0A2P4YVM0_9STRA|nr:Hypothetical protein PHPALM_116 [Phytophthora palmivora]
MDYRLALFGRVMTYSLLETGSEHTSVVIAEQIEVVMLRMIKDAWNISAIITDNPGQCGRARRILSLRWPRFVFIFCFAHANLVKAILNSACSKVTKQTSDVVDVLYVSSAKWLVGAKKCKMEVYGRSWEFTSLCETRWNSMQGCLASLLRFRHALKNLALFNRTNSKFTEGLQVLNDQCASLKLQRDENTLADIVGCYIDNFKGF